MLIPHKLKKLLTGELPLLNTALKVAVVGIEPTFSSLMKRMFVSFSSKGAEQKT
ncbi:MAG TPA: hypothetical protein V6D28_31235 [Leptolyngbyaceae cyanobacterium]